MAVVVRLPTVLRPFAGGAERVEVDVQAEAEPTVGAVLATLEGDYPALRRRLTDEQGALRRHVNVFLGNDNVRDLDTLATRLKDGDELLVLPSVAGG
jgi:sulfur-carrier protein